jgi:hypothetical protein
VRRRCGSDAFSQPRFRAETRLLALSSLGTTSLADRNGITYTTGQAKDPNGNYLTVSASSIVDTHGLTYSVASVLDSGFVAPWVPGASLTLTAGPFETQNEGALVTARANIQLAGLRREPEFRQLIIDAGLPPLN